MKTEQKPIEERLIQAQRVYIKDLEDYIRRLQITINVILELAGGGEK